MGFLTGAASLGDGWKLLVIDLDEKRSVSGSATWDSWIVDRITAGTRDVRSAAALATRERKSS